MEDKFINGVIGGGIAGVLKDIPDAVFHHLFKTTDLTFWDYAGFIALGRHPANLLEQIYSLFYEIIFSIFIGITFVFLAPRLKTKHYLIRGATYGALVWFAIRAAVIGFRLEPLIKTNILTSVVNSLNSILYGMVLGAVVHWRMEKREKVSGR